jgi:hypothetical protein
MKWFKHETKRKAALKKIIIEFGMEGYGLYWACVELIAGDLDIKNLTFELEEDAQIIADEFKMDTLKVEKIMHRCIELGLFDLSDSGRLRCLHLAKLLDESISKNHGVKDIKKKISDKIDKLGNSGNIPETFRIHSGGSRNFSAQKRREEKRIEEIRINKNREDKNNSPEIRPEIKELTEYIFEQIKSNSNPPKWNSSPPKLQNWYDDIEKLNRIDKIDVEQIKRVITWSTQHNFWKSNILSGSSLRKHFDKLYIQMKNEAKKIIKNINSPEEFEKYLKGEL